MKVIKQIKEWAGELREASFAKAAEFVLNNRITGLIETGCYRGTIDDGRSTLILASLAYHQNGMAWSFECEADHKNKVLTDLFSEKAHYIKHWTFVHGDSVEQMAKVTFSEPIRFVYLDSYDHIEDRFIECQRHQLAEVGAILGRLTMPAAILMDDNIGAHRGKVALSVDFLRLRGWKTLHEDYQVLMSHD